ncbi:pilus assembly protein PilY [Pyxidicoccus trucidator]|uniref:pilus assembly protein PilY n=1 Tax=Pyxidicoccus trucidator TaxID=2709662 RepID=UPI0013DC5873|nr:pilus assembly protein PilY [Pyxidicoccus trucidator]
MRLSSVLITALVLAVPGAVRAQDAGTTFNPCIDTTGQDRQPDFTADAGGYSAVLLTNDAPPKLRLNTNQNVLDPERIILPFEQDLEALIVDDQAGNGASHTLGWFYYQDLIDKQYIAVNDEQDANDDTLIDADNSGVPDFHEDLFNLNPARPYIGLNPRCPLKPNFTHTRADGTTIQLREPELLTGACTEPSTYTSAGGPRRWPDGDARYPQPRPGGGAVGRAVRWADLNPPHTNRTLTINGNGPAYTQTDGWFSDQGLFPHIPNLLEPKDPKNGDDGIGHLAFLATDDDGNTCPGSDTSECLQPRMAWSSDGGTQVGPVWDRSGANDGIPDYKASAFDNRGHLIPGKNPTAAANEEDRRVKIGRVQGNKEIVFFLVTYVEQIYGEGGHDSTDSCFMTRPVAGGRIQCQLWAHGDINVFFSKTLLNMDLHQTADPLVTTKNLRTGWLGNGAYARLEDPLYGRVFFDQDQPKEVRSYGQRAAHTIVGAPNNNPRVWILGWEDQNSGGNRTYNDIVILINKQNNGVFKSEVVSDISPSISRDYTITSVTLTIDDHPFYDPNGNSGACTPSIPQPDGTTFRPRPKITYQVALDCKVCVANCDSTSTDPVLGPQFEPKPTEPEWVTVPFTDPTAPPGQRVGAIASIDNLLERGYTGTQLCWRAVMESPGEGCQPTIANVNVSYKAQKAGQYARSSRIRVANTALFGVGEVPGRNWVESATLSPSLRLKDGRPDMSPRGHVYLKKLYEPENPSVLLDDSNVTNPPVWDAGEVQRLSIRNGDPDARKLYTLVGGTRTEVKTNITNNTHPLFPTTGTDNLCTDVPRYDLNNDGLCNPADRTVLKDWLYGWEKLDPAAPNNATLSPRRTWPMGSINLSTPAMVGPVTEPAWMSNPLVTEAEKTRFRTGFKDATAIAGRRSVAFVGTNQGLLHALSVGKWNAKNDPCTDATEYSGHFELTNTSPCSNTRQYGSGEELFAYLPGKMLRNYVETYLRTPRVDRPPATMDSSPTFASVDLGPNTNVDSTGTNDYNARRGYVPGANAWTLNTDPTLNTGAKTVLASAAGPSQSVFFALDVTDPNPANANYPWPMWEYDINNEYYHTNDSSNVPCVNRSSHPDCRNIAEIFQANLGAATPVLADTRGSRHNPLLVRMDFGTRGGKKWVAAFATDFTPRTGTAGTLYLMDVKTGQPVTVNHGSGMKQKLAGVVTLGTTALTDHNEGIGGSPSSVDVDGDGTYDVLYVPSTSGKVYKINLRDVDASRGYGKAISSCVIANAKTATYSNGSTVEDPNSQRIYSNLTVRTTRTGSNATVDIFFGTANNPDTDTDPDDLAATPRRYHIMAFRDPTPLTPSCTVTQQWVQRLDLGQAVWGGLAMREDAITAATAVGSRADVCSVSDDTSGRLYSLSRSSGDALPGSGTELSGHSFSAPLAVGQRLIIFNSTAGTGTPQGTGLVDPPQGNAGGSTSRVLIWDVRPGGNIREVIP